jgi:hypothetical protein
LQKGKASVKIQVRKPNKVQTVMDLCNERQDEPKQGWFSFALLWFLPLAIIVTLTPIVRTVQDGGALLANPLWLVVKLAFLALLFFVWSGLLVDQMPCFLGVPNCDEGR